MIVTERQDILGTWLCNRIGLTPSPNLRCIGNLSAEGGIIGVVGYDGFNGASAQMHSAGDGNWVTRDLLFAAFDYPFNVCKLNMVLGLLPSGNTQAIKFNTHLGFRTVLDLPGAHPDGSLIVMVMERRECRFLKRKAHGQEIRSATSARLH